MNYPDLPEQKDLSLAEKVYQALKMGILSMNIKPREALFIGDLADFYQISRTPVREALISLEKEGWVKIDGRRGARVIIPSPKSVMEMVEVYAVLEAHTAKRAAEVLQPEDIQQLQEILVRAEKEIINKDETAYHIIGDKFHRHIHYLVGNQYIRGMVEELDEQVVRFRQLLLNKGYAPMEISAKQHREILNAIENRQGQRAFDLMYKHTLWYEEEIFQVVNNL